MLWTFSNLHGATRHLSSRIITLLTDLGDSLTLTQLSRWPCLYYWHKYLGRYIFKLVFTPQICIFNNFPSHQLCCKQNFAHLDVHKKQINPGHKCCWCALSVFNRVNVCGCSLLVLLCCKWSTLVQLFVKKTTTPKQPQTNKQNTPQNTALAKGRGNSKWFINKLL